ncbi:MAG: TIGR02300 family protein [Alphaproteobacteria bacterium]|nr:TIGR02300 family protein [Alphaproteobacteria bacterium]
MSKPELGIKRDCPECGARFYDLCKEPAHCPKCDHDFVPEALLKPRKTRAEETGEAKPKEEAAKPAQETTLKNADDEKKGAKSNRRPGLDGDGDGDSDDDDDDDELSEIEGITVDVEDDDEADEKGLLVADDDDDDVAATIVKPTGDTD